MSVHPKHALERASERYGIILGNQDIINMEKLIREGKDKPYWFMREGNKTRFLPPIRAYLREGDKSTNQRIAGEVLYKGKWFIYIFRTSVNEIVTLMHPDTKFNSEGCTITKNLH